MKNKIYLWILGILLILPLVMAIDSPKPALDLYYLFVENVFGGIWIAGVGLAGFFILIGIVSGMSPELIIQLIGLFVMVYSIGIIGGIAAMFWFIFVAVYFMYGLLRLITANIG